MFRGMWGTGVWLATLLAGAGVAASAAVLTRTDPPAVVQAFASGEDLTQFLKAREKMLEEARRGRSDESVALAMMVPADTITNVQEIGVDEGGLIKARGDILVVLRRGRLFTISTAAGALRGVDQIDAFPPGAKPESAYSAWYDEMLVVGDRVIVIGYDYGRGMGDGGTQVVRFRLSPAGELSFEDAYELKSFDYYSSENFASRVIGQTLILYAPLPLGRGDGIVDPNQMLPGMRAWRPGSPQPFTPIARPTDIHIAPQVRAGPEQADTLHAVSRCDLGSTPMRCEASGVIAAESRSFYVSPNAIYLWTAAYPEYGVSSAVRTPPASIYRMSLDGGSPTAVQARGAPLNQFSFRERDGALDVVVQDEGGDGMWARFGASGRTRLVHLPLARFGDGSASAGDGDYRDLPVPGSGWMRQNRFVGDHVLVSAATEEAGTSENLRGVLVAAPLGRGEATVLSFDRVVSRIEPLGRDALVVTSGQGTGLNLIRLDGKPRVTTRLTIGGDGEAESRSHGFFFRADRGSGGDRGLMALPVIRQLIGGADRYVGQAVDMIFVRREGPGLQKVGVLGAGRGVSEDDGCLVSCIDWYGDARPVFLGQRMFALLGYELVEGRRGAGGVTETARLDFSPARGRRD